MEIKMGKSIKTIKIERGKVTHICYPRTDHKEAEIGLFNPLTSIEFEDEFKAKWYSVCNPEMSYIKIDKVSFKGGDTDA